MQGMRRASEGSQGHEGLWKTLPLAANTLPPIMTGASANVANADSQVHMCYAVVPGRHKQGQTGAGCHDKGKGCHDDGAPGLLLLWSGDAGGCVFIFVKFMAVNLTDHMSFFF